MWKTTMLKKECISNVKKTWDRLCRLDISYPPNTIPTEMEPVIVGSKVYMWGGNSVSSLSSNKGNMWGGMPVSLSSSYEDNLNEYTFDPSGSPPFRLCEGPISRLIPPEFHDNYSDMRQIPVLSIEEKIYVLDLPRIRVFDPVHQSWKDLPHLPCLPNTDFRRCRHFFCGHKLLIGIDSHY
ncbi:hypothetical protein ACLB2K_054505 [Fragaria x ananassa]